MFAPFRRLLHPTGVVVKVFQGFGFVRPAGSPPEEPKDILVPGLVPELAGRTVDFTVKLDDQGRQPRTQRPWVQGVRLCDPPAGKGTIVKYNVAKGYGVVRARDGTEWGFRHSEVSDFGDFLRVLTVGLAVEFDVERVERGSIATHLRPIVPR